MLRVVSSWTGFLGGPGYTNHYFDGLLEGGTVPQQVHDKVKAFWAQVKSNLPENVKVTVSPIVSEIDPATGNLVDETNVTNVDGGSAGLNTGTYAAVAGACISWGTSGIVAGHRVKGRTFIVPLAGAAYQADGTLSSACVSNLQSAAGLLLAPPLSAATDFGVWKRPVGGSGGAWFKAVTGKVADKSAFLKSRRD